MDEHMLELHKFVLLDDNDIIKSTNRTLLPLQMSLFSCVAALSVAWDDALALTRSALISSNSSSRRSGADAFEGAIPSTFQKTF